MDLDLEAWGRWSAYRIAIKKPLRSVSEEATKLKLMRFGADQGAVVDQSIANGWQGLFAITPEKTDPTAPKKRTREQQTADDAQWKYLNKQSELEWDRRLKSEPLAKLKLASALLARYDVAADQGSTALAEKRSWLKERVAGLLREADAGAVLNDLECWRLVLRLFSAAGLRRLELRSKESIAKAVA